MTWSVAIGGRGYEAVQRNYPRPLHVALRSARCPAARLKHLAGSSTWAEPLCFGNHPDLEPWLTYEERWVSARTNLARPLHRIPPGANAPHSLVIAVDHLQRCAAQYGESNTLAVVVSVAAVEMRSCWKWWFAFWPPSRHRDGCRL